MTLLNPLGLLAAGATLPLVLWYLLRPRRRRVPVASTYLWHGVDRPATAATPWQRFRGDATFWLVLLALLALAVALARPALPVAVGLGDHTILVVDASGSMLAEEQGTSRAELARRRAVELTESLGPGQEVSVIEAGARARIVLSGSTDAREVARTLAGVAPAHAPADLADAFTLATSLQRPGQRTVVHLLTDGRLPEEAAAVAPPGLAVSTVGSDRPNVAVTRLTSTPAGGGEHRLFVQLRSYAPEAVRGRLVVEVDDRPRLEDPVRLAPRSTEDLVLTVPAPEGARVTARLDLRAGTTGEGGDALPFDDAATIEVAGGADVELLLAGPGNTFLEASLASIPGVTVTTAATVPDDLDDVDVLVVDRVAAPATPPVPLVLVAPTRWPEGVTATGTMEAPGLTHQDTDHPLLADVDLSGLAVAGADVLDAPTLTALASGPDGPLLLAGPLGGAPTVVVPFDLLASDLPLRPAWPLLVANALGWLTGGDERGAAVAAGSEVTVPTGGRVERIVAHPPSGPPRPLDPAAPRLLVDRVGAWEVVLHREDGSEETTGVPVVAAPDEGDLARPREDRRVAVDGDGEDAPQAMGVRSLAWPFALAALALAVGEWAWSHGLARARRRRWRGGPPDGRAR